MLLIYALTDGPDLNTKDNYFDRLMLDEIIKTKNGKEIILLEDLKERAGKTFDNKLIGRQKEMWQLTTTEHDG